MVGRVVVVLVLAIVICNHVKGQDNTPKFSNEFLNIGVGARSLGLGLSSVSYVGDVTSGYWNPAGLNNIESDYQVSLMHSAYFGGIANYNFGAVGARLKDNSVISLSIIRFSVDDIPDTRFLFDANGVLNYDRIQFFSATDYGFLLTYAREIPILGGIKVGGNAKVIHRIVGQFAQSWGFGLDFGVQKTFAGWNFGITAKDIFGTFNAWSHEVNELREVFTLTGNEIPSSSVEVTLPRVIFGVSRYIDLISSLRLLATLDFDATFDGRRNTIVRTDLVSLDPHGGIELGFKKQAFLRLGFNQIQETRNFDGSPRWTFQPNFGLGIKIRELQIDYALTDVGNQADALFSHVFSINVNIDVEK